MHPIKLSEVIFSEKAFTQAVLQVMQMLGLYHAELARILHLQCADIGELSDAKELLAIESESWQQAKLFIKMYELLYAQFSGEETKIYNWLRKDNKDLRGAPLYLMVDELRIEDVIKTLST